jgi:hypothetical protein
MDAKVLRAAVSAAIRVTVSTTLIGCGGTVSPDPGRARPSPTVNDTPSTGQPAVTEPEPADSPSPRPATSTGGSASATETPSAGMPASGGFDMGGAAAIAGAGGEDASAGAPTDVCAAAAHACVSLLEQTPQEPLTEADEACCDTVIATLEELRRDTPREACYDGLYARFHGPVRTQCCADQSTWVYLACTPWGPPVPPEFSREALRLWSLAA